MKEIKIRHYECANQFAEAVRSQEDRLFRPVGYPIKFYLIDDLRSPIEWQTDRMTVPIGSRASTDFIINRAKRMI
jgi:hypothetical protein